MNNYQMPSKLFLLLLIFLSLFACQQNSKPDILLQDGDSFYLNPEWEIETIEFEHHFRVQGPIDTKRQVLNYANFKYSLEDKNVDPSFVPELTSNIKDLYPTQAILGLQPRSHVIFGWDILIVGQDGQEIQLSAKNNIKEPWNFVIDDQIYAQFNGAINEPLAKIFNDELLRESEGSKPDALFFSINAMPENIGELPFSGLESISDRFKYQLERKQKRFVGLIDNESGDNQVSVVSKNDIKKLVEVSYVGESGENINCEITEKSWLNRNKTPWEFICPAEGLRVNDRYRFPLKIVFENRQSKLIETTGLLWGQWAESQPKKLPIPDFLSLPIINHPEASKLVNDQTYFSSWFEVEAKSDEPYQGTIIGNLQLAGIVEVNQTSIPYTISTPFSIENRQLTNWTLTQEFLESTLSQIAALPVSHKLVENDPNFILQIEFIDKIDLPKFDNPHAFNLRTSLALVSCGTDKALLLPEDKPLISFTFYKHSHYHSLGFVLIDEEVRIRHLIFFPNLDERYGIESLLPKEIASKASKIESITVDATTYSIYLQNEMPPIPAIIFHGVKGYSPSGHAQYKKFVSSFPLSLREVHSGTSLVADNAIFDLNDDGDFVIRSCNE